MSDRSIAFALRVQKDAEKLPGQIGRAFRLVLGRKPTGSDRQAMRKYVTEMIELSRISPAGADDLPDESHAFAGRGIFWRHV